MQSCLNQLLGALQKMRVTPSARQCILGSMYELLELKVRLCLAFSTPALVGLVVWCHMQKMRVALSARQCILGSMYKLLELKVRPCLASAHSRYDWPGVITQVAELHTLSRLLGSKHSLKNGPRLASCMRPYGDHMETIW